MLEILIANRSFANDALEVSSLRGLNQQKRASAKAERGLCASELIMPSSVAVKNAWKYVVY
jgi:hypothetical protein